MEISSIQRWNGAATSSSASASGTSLGKMDSGQFMQILMAQLTHQNPLEPLKDAEMMNQFTQLNSLQELQSIQSSLTEVARESQSSYAASLIGRIVKVSRPNGAALEGLVTGMTLKDGKPELQIGSETASLSSVIQIRGE